MRVWCKPGSRYFYQEKAKASVDSLGTAEDAEYTFYDVTFTVDGNEAELPKGAAEIRMEFKNIPILEKTMQQMHGLFPVMYV